jgi:hypothetical protein
MKGRTIFTALATILLVSMVIVSAVGSAQDPSYTIKCGIQNTGTLPHDRQEIVVHEDIRP